MHRLRPHVMSTERFSECQSAYRLRHSTETALLEVVNDVVTSACDRQTTVLLSLDISAAFDSIDHDILLERLGTDFGNKRQCTWLAPFFRHGSDAVRRRRYRAFTTSQLYIWRATGQCAWTAALCHVHFTDEQRCCSTRSLLLNTLTTLSCTCPFHLAVPQIHSGHSHCATSTTSVGGFSRTDYC